MSEHDIHDLSEPNLPPTSPTPPNRPSNLVPPSIWAGLAAAALLAGGGAAWWTWQNATTTHSPQPVAAPEVASPSPTDFTQAPIAQTVQIYWLRDDGSRLQLVPAPVQISAAGQPDAILKTAFEEMLKGAPAGELASTIPEGTQLRSIAVKEDGVHVDLSQEFTSGGGSASMMGRVGQVIYTATTLEPNAPVWLSVEGEPLEVLGGEGLLIDQPMTRQSFDQNFPL
ncbi:MAG: GerMN domain-containing protein [Synechococcales cyanobacterium C42_A2020_086]|nr:GerMN domain-containing protein [Synechococcales cyanobacterium C42_A2020_086]